MPLFDAEFDNTPYARTGENLRELAFPLGGIGTGCVSLDGRGGLRDWEIFGRPNKGTLLEYTFPALWFQEEGESPRALALLGPKLKDWLGTTTKAWDYGSGRGFQQMDGLPCFDSIEFVGTFPFARVRFLREDVPLEIELEAFNPFIPLATRDSSFPGAVLTYRITNRSSKPVSAVVAWSMMNPVGEMSPPSAGEKDQSRNRAFSGSGDFSRRPTNKPANSDEFTRRPDQGSGDFSRRPADQPAPIRGIAFSNDRFGPDSEHDGAIVLATDHPGAQVCERWSQEGWWDSWRTFWTGFRKDGVIQNLGPDDDPSRVPGTLGCRVELQPGETAEIPFVLAWRFPNAIKYWGRIEGERVQWKAHYGKVWPSAASAATELLQRREELRSRTKAFETALYGGSQPPEVLESVGATLSVLHSPTIIRLADGTFWAWEGCHGTEGCCEGTCSHVWNYALSHAYLFPEMQRSFLNTAFNHTFNCGPQGHEGAMVFRVPIPIGSELPLWHGASDGQLGQIVQIYRDWRLTGDSDWLRSIYPLAKKAMGFAWVQWDRDRDGLVEGDMHNTYDINFCTPNPLTQFFYLAALRAMSKMAAFAGDEKFGAECSDLELRGAKLTMEKLWTGEFFRQTGDFTDPASPRYQHGAGCLTDQLLGQFLATVAGLGDLVDAATIESGLQAIFRHNFRAPLGDHENLQRVYALSYEDGLLACSWPDGEVPAYPFPYSDEVWTGMEYHVASHLAMLGHFSECEQILRGIRRRYDGVRRNPWNEIECGSHYARCLSSYGLMLAYTGMRRDAVEGTLGFRSDPFRGFFCTTSSWGVAERRADGSLEVKVIEGS